MFLFLKFQREFINFRSEHNWENNKHFINSIRKSFIGLDGEYSIVPKTLEERSFLYIVIKF